MKITEGSPIAEYHARNTYVPLPFDELYAMGIQYDKQKQALLDAVSTEANSILNIKALDTVTDSYNLTYQVQDKNIVNSYANELSEKVKEKSQLFADGKIKLDEFRSFVRNTNAEVGAWKKTIGSRIENEYNTYKKIEEERLAIKDANVRQDRYINQDSTIRSYGKRAGALGGGTMTAVPVGEKYDIYGEIDKRAKDIGMEVTSGFSRYDFENMGVVERKRIQRDNFSKVDGSFNSYYNTELSRVVSGTIDDEMSYIKEAYEMQGKKPTWTIGGKKYSEKEYRDIQEGNLKNQYKTYFINKARESTLDTNTNFSFLPEWIGKDDKKTPEDVMSPVGLTNAMTNTVVNTEEDVTGGSGLSGEINRNISKADAKELARRRTNEQGYKSVLQNSQSGEVKFTKNGKEISESEYSRILKQNEEQALYELGEAQKKNAGLNLKNFDILKEYLPNELQDPKKFKDQLDKSKRGLKFVTPTPHAILTEQRKAYDEFIKANLYNLVFNVETEDGVQEGKRITDIVDVNVGDVYNDIRINSNNIFTNLPYKDSNGGGVGGSIIIPGVKKPLLFTTPLNATFQQLTNEVQDIAKNSFYKGEDTYTKESPKSYGYIPTPVKDPKSGRTSNQNLRREVYTVTVPIVGYDPNSHSGQIPFITKVFTTYYDVNNKPYVIGTRGGNPVTTLEESFSQYESRTLSQLNANQNRILATGQAYNAKDVKNQLGD